MTMDDKQYTLDRRPITSRDRAASKKVAHWLVERGVSPNAISLSGMVAALAAGAALAATSLPHAPRMAFAAAAVLIGLWAVLEQGWRAPLYWEHQDGRRLQMTLTGPRAIEPAALAGTLARGSTNGGDRPSEESAREGAELNRSHGAICDRGWPRTPMPEPSTTVSV